MDKPIRLGLIGCGGIVQNTHARAYRDAHRYRSGGCPCRCGS